MQTFQIRSASQTQFVDITGRIASVVKESGVEEGICCVYVPHTTAAVTINENADPSVQKDILKELNKLIPLDDNYSHVEGNSAAHIKASLVGESVVIPISGRELSLGPWQGIFFCEFDGPRSRNVYVTVK
jgi:secondary thiamine-phosphate synthase enzyme